MAKSAICLFMIFLACYSNGQINPQLNQGIDLYLSKEKYISNKDFTSFKALGYDSLNTDYFLLNREKSELKVCFSPSLETFAISNQFEKSPLFGAGGYTRIQFRKKLKLGFDALYFSGRLPKYQEEFIAKNRVHPANGIVENQTGGNLSFFYHNFFLEYEANKYFTLSTGIGRQFIGDGYRSLLRSNYQNASPFFKIKTKFWKIEYTNLFEVHQDIYNVEFDRGSHQQKFIASHFLDWKVSKWFTLGLFESVIWQNDDGQFSRGFDPNYLNPFIFYRPIEFSTGSSDNVIVGSNMKFTVLKKQILYSQILLDEFLLAELRADVNQFRNPDQNIQSGWWANKYALQFGWRSIDLFNVEGLESRIEYNMTRPFTYAHSSPVQSYSNFNMPLAHPLGANFEEYILFIQYSMDSWLFKCYINHNKQGISLSGSNFGENVQFSNSSRIQEYENTTLQGNLSATTFLDFSISRLVLKKTNTNLQIGLQNRSTDFNSESAEEMFLYFKVSSNLHNIYFDF